MTTSSIHRTCLHCGTETSLDVPADPWHAWTVDNIPADRALSGINPDHRRWLTQMTCPDCYRHHITNGPADYYWEGHCAGCARWETFAVSTRALHAFHAGDLSADDAFPHLTDDQRCLIEMHCHTDCYCDAVYGRPPGEPNPFAHLDQ